MPDNTSSGAESVRQPLAGIRVIEFGNLIAGPFCSALLADMGADVIKIEHPVTGDMGRNVGTRVGDAGPGFFSMNRNKRSATLDLKSPLGKEAVMRLAQTADVILENFRPGVMKQLGLDVEAIRRVNPRIVYVSVSGFGQTGPYRNRAGVNLIVEAFSGTLSVTGEPGQKPARPGIQTGDVFGALFAAYATLSGLVGRARNGDGRFIDVSLVEASLAAAAWETQEYLTTGEVPQPLGDRHRFTAPYQLFPTSDGRFIAVGAPNDGAFRKMMRVLDREDLADDPRFQTYRLRKKNEAAIAEIAGRLIITREARELEREFVAAGLPSSLVNTYEDIIHDPNLAERCLLQSIRHPDVGEMNIVRNPILFDRGGPRLSRPPPRLGEHTQEVLDEIGLHQPS